MNVISTYNGIARSHIIHLNLEDVYKEAREMVDILALTKPQECV